MSAGDGIRPVAERIEIFARMMIDAEVFTERVLSQHGAAHPMFDYWSAMFHSAASALRADCPNDPRLPENRQMEAPAGT